MSAIATTMPTRITAGEKADLIDRAADVIEANDFCRTFWYDIRQATAGVPLEMCRVDLIGALNVAIAGTPRYVGDERAQQVEETVAAYLGATLAGWCSRPGNGKAQAVDALRGCAAKLRGEAA